MFKKTGSGRVPGKENTPLRVIRMAYVLALVLALNGMMSFAVFADDIMAAPGTLFAQYEAVVRRNAQIIDAVIAGGGTPLVKSVTVRKKDKSRWKTIEKKLRKGKTGNRYYRFNRNFSTELELLGFTDVIVGSKYRYLELPDIARSVKKPYYPYMKATKRNKKALKYYYKHQKKMKARLNSIYAKEIAPYSAASLPLKIAIASNLVVNFFDYQDSNNARNLPYTINTRRGVCADYCYMLDYLLKKAGLDTRLVATLTGSSSHMVNAIQINGAWFYVDPTNMDWGDYAWVGDKNHLLFSPTIDLLWSTDPGWRVRCVY